MDTSTPNRIEVVATDNLSAIYFNGVLQLSHRHLDLGDLCRTTSEVVTLKKGWLDLTDDESEDFFNFPKLISELGTRIKWNA